MKLLSERVKYILSDAKIEQGDLIQASGASKSVVSQWLSGAIKSMNLNFALEIERKYGYNHIWLMSNEGARKTGESVPTEAAIDADVVTADELMDLYAAYKMASKKDRELLFKAMKAAARKNNVKSAKSSGTGD